MSVAMQLFGVVNRDQLRLVKETLQPMSRISNTYRLHCISFQPAPSERGDRKRNLGMGMVMVMVVVMVMVMVMDG